MAVRMGETVSFWQGSPREVSDSDCLNLLDDSLRLVGTSTFRRWSSRERRASAVHQVLGVCTFREGARCKW